MPIVILKGVRLEVPRGFSGIIDSMAELDSEFVFEAVDQVEIFEYLEDRQINSMEHLIALVSSAAFYTVDQERIPEIGEYFWNELDNYEGKQLCLDVAMAIFLDVQANIDVTIKNIHKFSEICANISLKTRHVRVLYDPPLFNVVELTLEKMKYDEEKYLANIINSFANTLEKLRISTDNNLADVQKLPRLYYLNLRESRHVKSLAFCGDTLKTLIMNWLDQYTDEFLADLKCLEKLEVAGCSRITTVEPFAASLRELDAVSDCGIADEGLRYATNLTSLNAEWNLRITNVRPFAQSLRILNASNFCGLRDDGIAEAVGIVSLIATNNVAITTVAPFAKALRELDAAGDMCGITDAGLVGAVNLTMLNVNNNPRITTIKSFVTSLRGLGAGGYECRIADEDLVDAVNLTKLNANDNPRITTVKPFATSLRELDACFNSGISDAGIVDAVNLSVLYARDNQRITTLAPFLGTLREVNAVHNDALAAELARIFKASKLREIGHYTYTIKNKLEIRLDDNTHLIQDPEDESLFTFNFESSR